MLLRAPQPSTHTRRPPARAQWRVWSALALHRPQPQGLENARDQVAGVNSFAGLILPASFSRNSRHIGCHRVSLMPEDAGDADKKEPAVTGSGGAAQIKHLAKESAILLSSGIVSYVGAFGLQVLTARALGNAAFGAWAVAFALANTLATFGLMGADWILLRQGSFYEGAGDEERLRKTIRLALSLSGLGLGLVALTVLVASPLIATGVFHRDSLTPVIRVVAIMAPIMGLGQVLVFGTQAFKRKKESALIRNLLQPVARFAFIAVALLISATPLAAVTGMLCAEIVLAAASFYALSRKITLRGRTQPIEPVSYTHL